MQTETKLEVNNHPINATYKVGRAGVDEAGNRVIERQDRQVVVSITTSSEGGVFHRGARIA